MSPLAFRMSSTSYSMVGRSCMKSVFILLVMMYICWKTRRLAADRSEYRLVNAFYCNGGCKTLICCRQ